MSDFYCDYIFKARCEYRLVVGQDRAMPEGTVASDWELVRTRPAELLSEDGRKQVDDDGYALIRVNLTLDELSQLR